MPSKFVEIVPPPTAKGTASPLQPSDGIISVIGPRLEGHSVIFLAIQTHPSCRFLLAVDSLGLCRSGSSSQFIDPPQDFPKQVPRHGNLRELERDVPPMADDLRADLNQLLLKSRHRSPSWAAPMSALGPGCVKTSKNRPKGDISPFVEISVLMKSIT